MNFSITIGHRVSNGVEAAQPQVQALANIWKNR